MTHVSGNRVGLNRLPYTTAGSIRCSRNLAYTTNTTSVLVMLSHCVHVWLLGVCPACPWLLGVCPACPWLLGQSKGHAIMLQTMQKQPHRTVTQYRLEHLHGQVDDKRCEVLRQNTWAPVPEAANHIRTVERERDPHAKHPAKNTNDHNARL